MECIRSLRLKELACKERMAAVRCGLASVIPLQLLSVFTASDLDLRVCGVPDIDLDYLRVSWMVFLSFALPQSVLFPLLFMTETHYVSRWSG